MSVVNLLAALIVFAGFILWGIAIGAGIALGGQAIADAIKSRDER